VTTKSSRCGSHNFSPESPLRHRWGVGRFLASAGCLIAHHNEQSAFLPGAKFYGRLPQNETRKQESSRGRHQEFLQFLRRLDPEFPGEIRLHLVLDNYGTHKQPKVQAWLKRHPRFVSHFVPTSCSEARVRRIRHRRFQTLRATQK
jgi:hypothetical protein